MAKALHVLVLERLVEEVRDAAATITMLEADKDRLGREKRAAYEAGYEQGYKDGLSNE